MSQRRVSRIWVNFWIREQGQRSCMVFVLISNVIIIEIRIQVQKIEIGDSGQWIDANRLVDLMVQERMTMIEICMIVQFIIQSQDGIQQSTSMAHLQRPRLISRSFLNFHGHSDIDLFSLLKRHPNRLFNILSDIVAKKIYPQLTTFQKIKIIALVGYVHRVMIKDVQQWLQTIIGSQCYWKIDDERTSQLETLNVIALIEGLNFKILNISSPPSLEGDSYHDALWTNAVVAFSHGEWFEQTKKLIQTAEEASVLEIRSFINDLVQLKQHISQLVYSEQNTPQHEAMKNRYHELDLQLAQMRIITVNYLPEDYDEEYIEIWLDRTVELNSLLGNFVCKEKFGEFEYIRGPLTYTMQQGITLLFNNFNQISNELLVSIVSLAREGKMTHNQKTIKASPGFKIIGILSGEKNNKSKININKLVHHIQLPTKTLQAILPKLQNQTNRDLLLKLFRENQKELGYRNSLKLWKRIQRLRKQLLKIDSETFPQQQKIKRLWNSYFTQQFIDDIQLEINDLTNKKDSHRQIGYQEKYKQISIGRTQISYHSMSNMNIVKTQYSLAILEKLNICFELEEYPLLISETGCGKTTLVQYLSQLGGHKLYVYNMSSGTDVTDLIGGFKPVDCRLLLKDLFNTFLEKFREEVPGAQKNETYLASLNNYYIHGKIEALLKSLVQSIPRIMEQLKTTESNVYEWKEMMKKFTNILQNLDKIDSNLVFSFLEGNLIKAIKNGDWILIDEINLATNDVLQKIIPLIEGKSLMLYEKGDLSYIERHKDFRIVACMNPANDSGKKPLPPNLAEKFTSIVMTDPSRADIEMMTKQLCPQLNECEISELYFEIKKIKTISLRNLSRALAYINRNKDTYGWSRCVYDGLMLGFGEKQLLKKYLNESVPKVTPGRVEISGFLLEKGDYQTDIGEIFHLTDTFKSHLKDLLRAIAGTELPVLLEGPTSAGKTSMIRHVAETVGYKCIRINNHEHTEIEEYIGNYFPDKAGKLVFREGPLVTAVREGYWLILDELNLAKTQILECLNRLLDDNRELFIPEQQKHIKPHQNFRIFATQNPASYSGRKTLSRAFRNRFVGISFADINTDDTMAILQARSPLLKDSKQLSSFLKKTLQSLMNFRQRQRVFEKEGLITIRNLLKWCERPYVSKEKFIIEGYAILAEKLRSEEQKKFVEKAMLSSAKLTLTDIRSDYFSLVETQFSQQRIAKTDFYVQMNDSFKRMAALTIKAINNREPVLLVGETGCGKTTLAQLIAALSKRPFFSINCHKHMEASDLLGSLRPSINPSQDLKFQFINGVVIDAMLQGGILLIDEINTAEDSVLERLNQVLECGIVGIERGEGWETVEARPGFCIIGTMNPSGDYGKKELSPALRNRFTEIWVEPITHPEYITSAGEDIMKMISHKLTLPSSPAELPQIIYSFLVHYNCEVAPRYNLTRKLMTMRDIGWICKFINESQFDSWQQRYFWSITILAIEGIKYLMTDNVEGRKLEDMKEELLEYLRKQIEVKGEWMDNTRPEDIVTLLKTMNFPLLIKTDVSVQVLGIQPDSEIFFSPQTDLSDLLGQYRPHGNDFVWHDQPLLKRVKEGGVVALIDLNMAQQQVVEGVNSLFDHRGCLFVVELNQTFYKAPTFKGVVVLREEGGNGRKGLPNSFLNRFVKIYIPEVSHQKQLNFLIQKYQFLDQDTSLKNLILTFLKEEKHMVIEHFQFIIQFSQAGLLNQALEILNLNKYLDNSYPSRFSTYESEILELLPLRKSFWVVQPTLIKIVIQSYLVYKYSTFSLCLVGESEARVSVIKALGYLLSKNIVSILISTMLDINDLLGTYEQISTEEEKMQVQKSLIERVFSSEKGEEYKSEETKFAFVESRVVRSLQDLESIVYVQVPNEGIAERIEKGLTEVYNQNKKMVMGIDVQNQKKTSINKFISIDLAEVPVGKDLQDRNETYQHFPSNETNLTLYDKSIRRRQTESMISDLINDENDRGSVSAWRRVVDKVLYNSSAEQVKNKEQIKQKIIHQNTKRYGTRYIQNLQSEQRTKAILNFVDVSSSKAKLLSKISLFCFFTSNKQELNKKLIFLGSNQQQLTNIINKFQVLYLCNVNNFRLAAQTILPMIFNSTSKELTFKYFKEIERMYEELFKFKVIEILIQYSEEEHKLVPIVGNQESVKYLMGQDPVDIRTICDEGVHLDHILHGIEKVIVENVKFMQVDIKTVSQWSRELKIKNLGAVTFLQQNMNKKLHLLKNPLEEAQTQNFLKQLSLAAHLQSKSPQQKGLFLWSLFKPSSDMNINVSYHLKNELNLKYYNELVSNDNIYLQKYTVLSKLKYCGYLPSDLEGIAKSIEGYQEEVKSIQKMLVYRGHDNLENLIDFYAQLMVHTARIEESDFDGKIIRDVVIETYHSHYHIYNDILMPYYLALLAIFYSKYEASEERKPSISKMIERNRVRAVQLIDKMVEKEDGEVDRSKDYVKFQRKFNKTVIVDEYTEEGVAKNKENLEQEFQQLFGRSRDPTKAKVQGSPFQQIHMLINKTKQNYYKYLSQSMFSSCQSYEELVCGLHILMKYQQTKLNIYEEYNPGLIQQLVAPLTNILLQVHNLVNLYPIDNIKNLANICSKIQERSIYDEVYKILTDCEYLIEKIFEINPILPLANHIQTQTLIENCLRLRRIELKNWKDMLDLKVRRTQKSDMIQFLSLYKTLRSIQNEKQLFSLCQKYLRESRVSCLASRIKLLLFLESQRIIPQALPYKNALFRVIGFYSYIMPDLNKFINRSRKEKEMEMREYEKLAGWNSNEYLIFKATCEKFQRKIHHILRRFDEEMSMTVGNYHQQILAEQFYSSIKDFKAGLTTLLENKEEMAQIEEERNENEIQAEDNAKKAQRIQEQKESEPQLFDPSPSDSYEQISKRIFTSLSELQEEHHNTQSKLLIIRAHLSDLEDTFSDFILSANVEYKFITREMFDSDQSFKRGSKYYYGLWDKLCQRSEVKWNREVIDRLWHVTEKIWVHINLALKYYPAKTKNQIAEDLKIIAENFMNQENNSAFHPLFKQELDQIKTFLSEVQQEESLKANSDLLLSTEIVSLMKLGYILANIAVNLQKNGLCAKEENEENQENGSEEVADGMGIGEGDVHEAAQNVGDEIQFEEQVMGHKDEQKNQNDNAENKQEKDIEMQNDFEGQMYSKEEEKEGDGQQEGEEKEADEKMGSVDEKQKEQDMKNEAGEAQGSEEADVDIKNQKEGDEELIDNEREQKDERKGQDKRDMNEQGEEEEEKSDWDDDNQEGEKINKQKEDVEAREEESSINMDQKQPENMEEQGPVSEGEEEQKQEQGDKDNMEEENEELSEVENQNGEKNEEGSDIEPEPEDLEKQDKPRDRKGKQSNKYNPAFGRRDINTNNEVLNDEEEHPAQEEGEQGNQEKGGQEGNQGSGNPIHNLSSEFLEEILKQQRAEGNEKFVKDLNVLMNDKNEELPEAEDKNAQQFQMTEQKDKFATNLPLVDDQKMKNEEQERQEQKKQERNAEDKKDEKKQGDKKEQAKKEKEDKQKPGKDLTKNCQNKQMVQSGEAIQKRVQLKSENKIKQEPNREKVIIDIDQDREELIRSAIAGMKVQPKAESSYQNDNANQILSQAFEVSKILEEQLKSVLEPMDNAEYRGDFKTGKKLNLKKIIPFIASNYRKDRIWLRRTEPSERNYYVMIALDDTKSMHYGQVGSEALKGMLAISMALEHLSIKTSICSIRDEMLMLKKFGDLLNSQTVLNNFQFEYESSNSHDLSMAAFMNSSLQVFKKVEEEDMNIQVKKLCFIISDGKMNKKLVTPFMKEAKKEDITYIFIVVDSQQSSILSIKSVQYVEKKMKIKNYMSDFPFEYFLIINDVKELGEILAMTLLQFIQEK